ncbi:MAG: 3-methyl-2-oxobutanoate dehydrogenase subunit VorB [Candidatus Cloacimonetes bacterium]|jgi:2-oxoglutarate ferredoxin oxidoreductase subunit alpha|uniref:3-methyl-2-oxobutanoate dehydrogenase subunit VorB n=1 Tax=Candidatus Syntrophosphaera thermopropionivorans TaxID=2593015 RepID=A0AC61QKL6_9BACT|nr:3-methyl-2-oxobutanoate dehydrogenase subunit VorB [Candidatus Syntrophosphaera sp.]NLA44710.1 3-methyl-2-oxobutanoate dehydrogenase subunit VorB [Candidatus Cloacimonadota bacterium]TDF74237.1 3-methyl-2-oxobutanoate dehydrogenase subunit VorB [Candidatus Syntrophosphaera thermopropionivorans]MBP7932391.1 3-methyl-2-oxobutanoate dehydrogenase subunit VorB [Candidatus Syntrophosphaera sp.]MBP9006350.1 3-methyl-2-oxobutanoate dehydrogenase subunit VorB [Candidatus Syntrophosphaera sp.]
MSKILMKGNEAVAEAAIRAGCRLYFAYPITPQSELIEYMAKMMPKVGGTFIQAESEIAAINMVYGAAGVGKRVMTSSSSPGISLKQEGISYMAGAELPAVIVNVQRGGPGLGDIQPAQGDYFQAVKGGGHGDYQLIVLAPSSVQEFADLAADAFDLADKYRNPVMILADGMLGQMMEPVEFKPAKTQEELDALANQHLSWCICPNADGDAKHHHEINSLELDPEILEKKVSKLYEKYAEVEKNEVRYETYNLSDDNEILCVAWGTAARVVKSAINELVAQGKSIGLVRPITCWPYPYEAIASAIGPKVKKVYVFELNSGQMVEDVMIAVNGKVPVDFWGKLGGIVFTPADIQAKLEACF